MKGESNPGYNELSIQKEKVMEDTVESLVKELGKSLVMRDIAKAVKSASLVGDDHILALLSAAVLLIDPEGPYPRQLDEMLKRYGIKVPNPVFDSESQLIYDQAEASGDPQTFQEAVTKLAKMRKNPPVHSTVQ